MKKTELKDLHTKTTNELYKLLKVAKEALMQLKLDHQQNKVKNTRELFNLRKQIAVLQTILQIKKSVVIPAVVATEVKAVESKKVKESKGGKK